MEDTPASRSERLAWKLLGKPNRGQGKFRIVAGCFVAAFEVVLYLSGFRRPIPDVVASADLAALALWLLASGAAYLLYGTRRGQARGLMLVALAAFIAWLVLTIVYAVWLAPNPLSRLWS